MCEHHEHEHHEHPHPGVSPEERLALLSYLLDHNRHHAQELRQLAHGLGHEEAAQLICDAVVDFEMGNDRLAEALSLLKEA